MAIAVCPKGGIPHIFFGKRKNLRCAAELRVIFYIKLAVFVICLEKPTTFRYYVFIPVLKLFFLY